MTWSRDQITQPLWGSEADRIISIRKRVQNIPPALLSTINFRADPYVIQEMQPVGDKVDFCMIKDQFREVSEELLTVAMLTASGNLRSSGRQSSAGADELIEFGSSKPGGALLIDYAAGYAKQVKNDYKDFVHAYHRGYFSRDKS